MRIHPVARSLRFAATAIALLSATACQEVANVADSVASTTTPTAPTAPNNPTPDYNVSFSRNETGEASCTLTAAKPSCLPTGDYLTLSQTTVVWAFLAAQFSVEFWALDAANATLFTAGQAFSGYRLNKVSNSGMLIDTLPAGTWYIGTRASGSVPSNYSNPTFHELATTALPGWRFSGNVPLGAQGNAGAWSARGFNIPSGDSRSYLETEGTGGKFMIMTASQYASFSVLYSNGYNGGTYSFVYALGGQAGGASTEIEGEMKLPAGTYYLVWLNDTGSWQGGAGNVWIYQF